MPSNANLVPQAATAAPNPPERLERLARLFLTDGQLNRPSTAAIASENGNEQQAKAS